MHKRQHTFWWRCGWRGARRWNQHMSTVNTEWHHTTRHHQHTVTSQYMCKRQHTFRRCRSSVFQLSMQGDVKYMCTHHHACTHSGDVAEPTPADNEWENAADVKSEILAWGMMWLMALKFRCVETQNLYQNLKTDWETETEGTKKMDELEQVGRQIDNNLLWQEHDYENVQHTDVKKDVAVTCLAYC